MRARDYFSFAAAGCLLLVLEGCSSGAAGVPMAPAAAVGFYTVAEQPLMLTTDLPGRTAPFRIAEVRPQVTGIVQRRLFTEGTEVKQGQQLYQIDPAPHEAALLRAEADLLAAQNLAERYARLVETTAISRQQYDDAVAAWKQAEAALEVARIDIRYTKVLAPIGGRIGRSLSTEGALVTAGQAQELATVRQLDPIYVDIRQPVTEMLRLQNALEDGRLASAGEQRAKVALELEDGTVYPLEGSLKFSEVEVDESTGSVALRAEFPNPDGKLLPGMFVHARLQEGIRQDAKLLPQQAVIRDSRGIPVAWVLKPDDTVELRELRTLRTVGNAWLVDEGIADGERVVTEGLAWLRAGMKVQPAPAANVDLRLAFVAEAE
jgi:membrane fusion protein, multidrug efflux system